MFKVLLLLMAVLVVCYLICLLGKLWLLSRRKTRLQHAVMQGRPRRSPARWTIGKKQRKE